LTSVTTNILCFFFFTSSRRHTISKRDWSSDVCSSDLKVAVDKKAATQRKVLGDGEHAALAVYQQLEKVTVTPDFAVARVGGDGRSEERRVGKSVDVRGVRWVGKNESY